MKNKPDQPPRRVRNCSACDHEVECRLLAEQWGPTAMACRSVRRDEHFRDIMAAMSAKLQKILADAGFERGAGIRLVTRVANAAGLRDWPDTRNRADYEALIDAVNKALEHMVTP